MVVGEVEVHIGIYKFYGFCTAVHRMNEFCPTPHGINAETTCVTKHIEDFTSLCILFHKRTVITLVHKEACLLSLQPIDMKFESVFPCNIVIAFSPQEAILLSELGFERKCCFALVIDGFKVITHNFLEGICQIVTADMHSDAMGLHDGCRTIDIHNQSRQVITFAMYKTIDVVILPTSNAYSLTYIECG